MAKVRLLGPQERLPDVLRVVQDIGLLHLTPFTTNAEIVPAQLMPQQERQQRNLTRVIADLEAAIRLLGCNAGKQTPRASGADSPASWARLARRIRNQAEQLSLRLTSLQEERALLQKYQRFFAAFEGLLPTENGPHQVKVYPLMLRAGQPQHSLVLREQLAALLGDGFELRERTLPGGEVAALLLVPPFSAQRVERLLTEGRVEEVPLPSGYTGGLSQAIPHMKQRLGVIGQEEENLRRELGRLAGAHCRELLTALTALHDSAAQVAPSLRQAVTRTRRDLEERERDEHARLEWVLRTATDKRQRSLPRTPESRGHRSDWTRTTP